MRLRRRRSSLLYGIVNLVYDMEVAMEGRKRVICAGLAFLLFTVSIVPENTRAKGTQLKLNLTQKTMTVGSTFRLCVKGNVAKNKKIIWKSSRRSVATVTRQGKVTAKRAGKAKIIVRISGMDKKAICSLTVRKKTVSTTDSPPVQLAHEEISPSPDRGEAVTMTPAATVVSDPTLTAQPNISELPSPFPSPSPIQGDFPPHTATLAPTATEPPPSLPVQTRNPAEKPIESAMPSLPPLSPSPGVTPMVVDSSILVVREQVITVDNTVMTAYLINKKFSGEICVSLNDKEYSTKSSGRSLLSVLKRGVSTKENANGTIRVSRLDAEEEYWTIEDRQYQKTYYMKADTVNTLDTGLADCGVIYILGDVRTEVKISGKVQT